MALEQVGGIEQKTGISRLTMEHLYWKVLSNNDLSPATTDAEVAFAPNTTTSKPAATDFTPAYIVPDPDNTERKAVRLLVGPGGAVTLTPDTDDPVTYRVWVRIKIWNVDRTTLEQSIVRNVGTLVVR